MNTRTIHLMESKSPGCRAGGFTIDYGTKGDERLAWNVDMSDAEARLKTELWVINTDGSNPRQLKHFNTPGYPEHVDGTNCIVADSVWAPDGKSIVAGVFTMKGKSRHAKLMRIELQ